MTNLNFLSNLCSPSGTDRSTTSAMTVGSPSVHRRGMMLKLCTIVAILLTIGIGNVWGGVRTGWTRVTSVSEITSGGTFIIGWENSANSNTIVPMINKASTLTAVDGSGTSYLYSGTSTSATGNGTIDMSDKGSGATTNYEFEIVTGSSSGKIAIKVSDGNYLGFYGLSNNNCKRYSSVTTNSSFTPTVGASSPYNVSLANVQYTSRYIKFNNNSTSYRFSNYSSTEKIVLYKKTASCTSEVDVTKGSETHGTYDLSGTTVCADGDGGEISASNIEPDDCYEFASITATVGTPDNTNKKVTGITAATTITVNFQKKTVNTYVDEIHGNADIEDCGTHNAPSLDDETPTTSGTCAQQHWHFAGWTTADYKASPEGHITTAGTEMTANGTTYYAVWSKGVAGTSFDGSTEGDYLIYTTISGTNYYATNTITNNTLTTTTNIALAQVYTFTKTGSNWYLTYTSGNSTYYLVAPNSNSGNMSAFSTTDACEWKIATDGTYGSWHIYSRSPNNNGTNTYSYRGLIYRVAASGFKNYTTSNLDGSDYFDCEIGSPTVYSDYICTCCTPLGTINGSFL